VINGVDVTRPATTPPGDASTTAQQSPFVPQQSVAGTSTVVNSASTQTATADKIGSKSKATVDQIGTSTKAKAKAPTTDKAGSDKVSTPKGAKKHAGAKAAA
jgi:hypothetical protein